MPRNESWCRVFENDAQRYYFLSLLEVTCERFNAVYRFYAKARNGPVLNGDDIVSRRLQKKKYSIDIPELTLLEKKLSRGSVSNAVVKHCSSVSRNK